MNWYYAINGQRQGPVAQSEFEKLVSTGVITDQTLIWKEGMSDWKPLSELRASLPPPLASAVPGAAPISGGPTEDTAVCVVSGKVLPKREMSQYEGRWVSAEHRDEFFQRIRQGMPVHGDGAVPGPYGYGGFWRRFCAKFIDGVIYMMINIPVNMLLGLMILGSANYFSPEIDPNSPAALGAFLLFQGVSILINIGIGLAYSVFFIRRYQATPGKLAMGLKLLRADGSHLTTGRIIGRYFAEIISAMVLYIGYIMAGFDQEKKSLHDVICDTRVIKTRQ